MSRRRAFRVPCPVCKEEVILLPDGLLMVHGDPECPRSGKSAGRIWPDRHHGRKVHTAGSPDTWSPTTEGAA